MTNPAIEKAIEDAKAAASHVIAKRDVALTRHMHGIITEELVTELGPALRTLAATIEAEALERAADVAESPYSDAVMAYGTDEPAAVGQKIARAIRAMSTPPAYEGGEEKA